MATEKVRVLSLDGIGVPYRTAQGSLVMGRWFGLTARDNPMPEGEVVECGPGNRNDLIHGRDDGHISFTVEE